jgi:hypothetical protein
MSTSYTHLVVPPHADRTSVLVLLSLALIGPLISKCSDNAPSAHVTTAQVSILAQIDPLTYEAQMKEDNNVVSAHFGSSRQSGRGGARGTHTHGVVRRVGNSPSIRFVSTPSSTPSSTAGASVSSAATPSALGQEYRRRVLASFAYQAIIDVANPVENLAPGRTVVATLSSLQREHVVRIPNNAADESWTELVGGDVRRGDYLVTDATAND